MGCYFSNQNFITFSTDQQTNRPTDQQTDRHVLTRGCLVFSVFVFQTLTYRIGEEGVCHVLGFPAILEFSCRGYDNQNWYFLVGCLSSFQIHLNLIHPKFVVVGQGDLIKPDLSKKQKPGKGCPRNALQRVTPAFWDGPIVAA